MDNRSRQTISTAQQVQSAQDAGKVHDWPAQAGKMTDESWQIYALNQCFRAYQDWNAADLFELARISKMQAVCVEQMDLLEEEGPIIFGGKNGITKIENPRGRVISTMNGTITSVLRRLGITNSNSGGDRTAKANRGAQERANEKGIGADKDSLI